MHLVYGKRCFTKLTVPYMFGVAMPGGQKFASDRPTEVQSYEEVLSLVQEQCSLMQVIKQRQANWIGHVLRHDCLLKTVLEGKIEGKRPRGKPRRKMLDLLMEQEDKKISYEELKTGAQSRVGWRHRHWNLP